MDDLDWLSEQPNRGILAVGVAVSLVLIGVSFLIWGLSADGFADDNYLWWTLAAFVVPPLAAVCVAAVRRRRPKDGPAVGVALVIVVAAFIAILLH